MVSLDFLLLVARLLSKGHFFQKSPKIALVLKRKRADTYLFGITKYRMNISFSMFHSLEIGKTVMIFNIIDTDQHAIFLNICEHKKHVLFRLKVTGVLPIRFMFELHTN